MNFIKSYKFLLIGITIGAIAGYLYYFYVGCSSGTCAITSKPINSTLYGAMMGGLLFYREPKRKGNSETSISETNSVE
ncbi:MAG: hypothetical protein GC181_00740 [Bacteroidetes bacterium]|nr:hypothetical protein [Bacteroidota bacterium]